MSRVRQVGAFMLTIGVAAVILTAMIIALVEEERDREAFIERCRNQGGKVIDLTHDPVCKFGRLTIEYGD